MSRRRRLEMEILRRGGVRCHKCSKRLNVNNTEYTPKTYPYGTVEMVPVCKICNGGT